MDKPSSRYLSYQCSLFKRLTFSELQTVFVSGLGGSTLLGLLIGLIIGFPFTFLILGAIAGGFLSFTFLPRWFAKKKKGKPFGYLAKKARLTLVRLNLIENPYTNYQGVWRKAKRFRR